MTKTTKMSDRSRKENNLFLRIVVFAPFKYFKLRRQKISKFLQDRVVGWCLKT